MENDFDMTPVTSSQIESVGWNNGELRIQFLKGGLYSYRDVSEEEFSALVAAPSVGSLFQQTIKGVKPYTKIG